MKIRSAVLAILAAGQIAAVLPTRPIERIPQAPAPTVSAPGWILYDDTNGVVLDGRAVDEPRPMASTTKIMTGLLALESGMMSDTVVVSERAGEVGESEIGLIAGERIPMEMLVHALLIRSANDAAVAVAEHLGGSVEGFVAMMNERAAELGLEHTSFENPHGLDAPDHYTSPRDLLQLTLAAMALDGFEEIVSMGRYRVTDAPDGEARVAVATNQLLNTYRGAFGVKTGFTFQAGLVLVAGAERDGRRLYVVVMGSDGPGAHFTDAARLLDHGYEDLAIFDSLARGTPFRLASRERAELTELAHLQAMVFVAALRPTALPAAPPEVVVPEPEEVLQADLPGIGDALGWLVGGMLDG